MKNQYVGDIGDYGKYGLLRYLSKNGVYIGVNWYLTKNDIIIKDGNIRDYLNNEAESVYDSEVYQLLKTIPSRDIRHIENSEIIQNAVYYHRELNLENVAPRKKNDYRTQWHKAAMESLKNVSLVFADPDNGSTNDKNGTIKNGEKYITISELEDYYKRGQNVVYYCHKARRSQDAWQSKMVELKKVCPDARIIVLTFHRGTQRSYIFGIHPKQYNEYKLLIEKFLQTNWGTIKVNGKKEPFSKEELLIKYTD